MTSSTNTKPNNINEYSQNNNTTNKNTENKIHNKMGDYSQLGSTNSKFHLKIDHPHNYSPKNAQLCMIKKERKEKGEERRVGMIIPS